MNRLLFLLLLAPLSFILNAQCNSWADIPEKEEAEAAHSVYREALKMDDLELAFTNWEKAYTLAPAADGLRDYHYMDGVKLYMKRFEAATDKATKDENANIILDLYDKCIECYKSGGIFIRKCTDQADCVRKRISFIRGRQGYDMYYKLVSPKIKTYNILKESLEEGGNDSEYIIIAPLAETMVKLYENGELEIPEFREVHGKLMAMAKHNSENHPQFASYFQQASESMEASVARVEREVYDCQYFKDKLLPLWVADKTAENAKVLFIELVKGGCDENDAELQELHDVYEKWAREDNARKQAEYEAANPIVTAKKLYDAGDFKGAEAKFQEAIEGTDDNTAKAQYLLSLASVQGRKLGKYSLARENAYKAAKMTPNWGSPYMLIGDLYASSSRNCGDAWGQRLAILAAIDKYAYAKSMDPEVADEAQKKINAYSGSKPSAEEAFMRGYEAGQTVKVGCWIGESVRLRF